MDASDDALALAEAARARRGISNVRFVKADVADLSAFPDASFDAVAAIDLVEHIDDPTLAAMLGECRRVLVPGGRLGLYTPDRAHYVERLKAHDFSSSSSRSTSRSGGPRRTGAFFSSAGFRVDLDAYSVSPFPGVRWIEAALAPLPLVGETFRYRILLRAREAVKDAPEEFAPNAEVYGADYYERMYRPHWFLRNRRKYEERDAALLRLVRPSPADARPRGRVRARRYGILPRAARRGGRRHRRGAGRDRGGARAPRGPRAARTSGSRRRTPVTFRPSRADRSTSSSSRTSSSTWPTTCSSRAFRAREKSFGPAAPSRSTRRTRRTGPSGSRRPCPGLQQEDHIAVREADRVVASRRGGGVPRRGPLLLREPYPLLGALDRALPMVGLCRFRTCLRAVTSPA